MEGGMSTTTAPPPTRPVNVAGIAADLAALPQWVCWKWSWIGGRWTKVPYNAKTGGRASTSATTTWAPLGAALACMERNHFPGIGFVLTPDDPFVGIDLDRCRDPETGEIAAWARQIVDAFDSLTEITPSETGLRIWITTHDGLLPGDAHGRRKGPVEIYGAGRFFTVTGHRLERVKS
jgi:primase-polymerase (primpol)-like protein